MVLFICGKMKGGEPKTKTNNRRQCNTAWKGEGKITLTRDYTI